MPLAQPWATPLPACLAQHIMIDLGTGNNNKINWAMNDKQEFVDIVETVGGVAGWLAGDWEGVVGWQGGRGGSTFGKALPRIPYPLQIRAAPP